MLLSSVQPGVVETLRVDSPIPQFSEHDDHGVVDALKHVALTVDNVTINFNKVSSVEAFKVITVSCGRFAQPNTTTVVWQLN
jgi:hypothetical protein